MTPRRHGALLYIRIVLAGHGAAHVFAPHAAGAAIKAALNADDRTWDPDRRCWVIPAELVPHLLRLLDPARYHVRLADTEPRSTLPLFRNANRRSPAA